jgi:limonene-1,2-epoxide hydrolase
VNALARASARAILPEASASSRVSQFTHSIHSDFPVSRCTFNLLTSYFSLITIIIFAPKKNHDMTPVEILNQWIEAFNRADIDALTALYAEDAVNHQVANDPIHGREAIREMFIREFAAADMVCIPENIFHDGQWAIMEWKDPLGLRGCGFFQVINNQIVFQRGYWDKLSFQKLYALNTGQ